MKKLIIPILLLSIMSTQCTNEVVIDKDAETKAIQTVIESMFDAIADIDTERLKTLMCDDFFAYDMNQAMKFEDLSNAVAGLAQMGFTDISYNVEAVKSYIFENNALACFKTTGTAKMGDQDIKMEFLESYLMMKTEDGWKIKFFHSTQLPPPGPPNPEAE